MSIFQIALAFGGIATLLFFFGLARGAVAAVRDADKTSDENETVEDGGYTLTAVAEVAASSTTIALVGINPVFIYLGPLLAIVSAAGIGIAFLVEDPK
ncbi:hypothetical protein U0027_24280 (plasmid) [Agrobacterium tumefaciens]|uniref:hypothetical protein n=1 Tax=Agrobacterium tumefaciens TaxID=358 RepID=UPI000E0B8779|nr:hypothetical protein [Agrobacterium tumefaciens]WQE43533.1 hypothetical protein U0027_24280 [Agrobacterium tumefaciens]